MLYRMINTIATNKGYRMPGTIVDLEAEGCGKDIERWLEAGKISKVGEEEVQEPSPSVPVPAPTPALPEPIGPATIWNLDAEALAGQSLAALNVMIAERDPNAGPFETQEEAIAQLTLQTITNEVENS